MCGGLDLGLLDSPSLRLLLLLLKLCGVVGISVGGEDGLACGLCTGEGVRGDPSSSGSEPVSSI